ncbi:MULTISPECIES: amino acid aminotransferase [Chlamydia]|uniref:Aminotransferase class I and II family protein n=2 Tax=Chlamydia TaxID=810 RepID=A0ABP2X477_CHLPS|nr:MULTISPECIES: amino acid aminotransferase [Chlamydia]AFS18991.1 aminotransferase class I and II family protein [Chlamydia psittaci 84/55]AFS22185.1 aminotransferase class I and II family protein [Chlamydia psittaci VS225]EPJ15825.1 aminotransferase class I and II family protein [Chlamydia psittaci 02DC18]EPJ17418.1 aminotransferase class I and II family protein [Chlamydia psittaci 02DC22]EPJ19683.1 aminotransferase class I and II family protein [Chlamydia psittaci 02DC23]EPJ20789.1 aminotr
MSFFNQLPTFAPDSILGLQKLFLEDEREDKVNLVIGSYEDPNKAYGGFSSVRKAQFLLLENEMNKGYLPISGLLSFNQQMESLVFGDDVNPSFVVGAQALGGTGALHLGAKIFSMTNPSGAVYIPEQTWGNHLRIFAQQGLDVLKYPYYSSASKTLVFDEMMSVLQSAPKNSLVLLQCCCHNPTGMDLNENMWTRLAELMKERQLLPFFDTAYLGFGSGIEKDRKPIKIFIDSGHTVFVAACASKNFSLYGERVGYFAAYSRVTDDLDKISSCLEEKIRGEYSSPPRHGAKIVSTILSDASLKTEWLAELETIRCSLEKTRIRFVQAMRNHIGHSFDFILSQKGFFGYPGFSLEQVLFLRLEKGIYTTSGARFNLNGITDNNIDHVVQSFAEAYQQA